ncbi:nucleoside triphosphate pyrophosphohydrolase [Actinorhabdospora filicis]|uniref:Nucleoside triphosphate pyrophosphohydrolase n=1 Tax=Actinorhabdospora filicis TaxID=1785913 RepID=A0A9W6SRM1_9ACTN|nr:MazG family protein [Actinorhabdospora filicis]GLZ80967.1 nucleoside triphosphate pyrophosphohydrolase [Actinorhabdospora filicis]
MAPRIVLLVTSPRLPAGLLSADAWDALRSAKAVFTGADSAQASAIRRSGVNVTVLPADTATEVLLSTADGATTVWLAAPDGDPALTRRLGFRLAKEPRLADIELLHGSWDPPGGRLLDVVSTMDVLRSPGGCPWDAEQDHESLLPYLVEETYEVIDAVHSGDKSHLREELGDLLLQVVFHARMAEDDPDDETRFTIDDVSGDLVAKLIRRHPHVFSDAKVDSADQSLDNWEAIKAEEKPHRESSMDGVAMAQPALPLAAKLQSRASRAGVTASPEATDADLALGAEMFALVAKARESGVDPELALRKYALAYAEAVRENEKTTS